MLWCLLEFTVVLFTMWTYCLLLSISRVVDIGFMCFLLYVLDNLIIFLLVCYNHFSSYVVQFMVCCRWQCLLLVLTLEARRRVPLARFGHMVFVVLWTATCVLWFYAMFWDDFEMIFIMVFQKEFGKKCIRFAKVLEKNFCSFIGWRGRSS